MGSNPTPSANLDSIMNEDQAIQMMRHRWDTMLGKTKGITIWGFDEDGDPVEYECDISRGKNGQDRFLGPLSGIDGDRE